MVGEAREPRVPFQIRALEAADLAEAAEITGAAFELDLEDPLVGDRWRARLALPFRTDPHGAFLAERDGRAIGVAQALRRERLWCLSLLAVRPDTQSAGAGRALLGCALAYGADADAGLIPSSNDPRALRLYALAGFSMLPTFEAEGAIERSALPRSHPDVVEGGWEDLEALAAISRHVRGAPHTQELEFALGAGGQLLRLADRGYVVAAPGHGVWLLAAYDEAAAAALLWSALALAGESEGASVRWITAEQQWAIDVVVRAGLRLVPSRALCVRGRPGSLRPYLPSGPFA